MTIVQHLLWILVLFLLLVFNDMAYFIFRPKLVVSVSEKERQRPTIIIHDTPSPVVSVITISDSEEEVESSIW